MTSATGVITVLGTIVAIAVGVHSLLPAGHTAHAPKATFGRITANPNIDLEEYEIRFGDRAVAQAAGTPAHPPVALAIPYRLMSANRPTSSGAAPAAGSTSAVVAGLTSSSGEATISTTESSTATSPGEQTTSTSTTSSQASSNSGSTSSTSHSNTTNPASSTSTSSSASSTTKTTSEQTTSTLVKPPPSQVPFKDLSGIPARGGTGAPQQQVSAVAGVLASTAITATMASAANTPSAANAPAGEATEQTSAGRTGAHIAVPSACASTACAVTPLIDHALAYNPNTVAAARAVAAAFADSRGRVIDHKLYASGVAVNYYVTLIGFAHREAILVWSLWSKTGGRPLPQSWLRNVIAEEVKPPNEEESFAGHFWLPTPLANGEYAVHLTVYDQQGIERGTGETEPPFH
jgi:hypothetical protein